MSHTIYVTNGKVSHIHRHMCEWDYIIDKSLVCLQSERRRLELKIIPDTWFSGLVYLPLECVVLLQQFSENNINIISNRCDSFNGKHVWPVTPIHSMEDMCGLSKQFIQWKTCVSNYHTITTTTAPLITWLTNLLTLKVIPETCCTH